MHGRALMRGRPGHDGAGDGGRALSRFPGAAALNAVRDAPPSEKVVTHTMPVRMPLKAPAARSRRGAGSSGSATARLLPAPSADRPSPRGGNRAPLVSASGAADAGSRHDLGGVPAPGSTWARPSPPSPSAGRPGAGHPGGGFHRTHRQVVSPRGLAATAPVPSSPQRTPDAEAALRLLEDSRRDNAELRRAAAGLRHELGEAARREQLLREAVGQLQRDLGSWSARHSAAQLAHAEDMRTVTLGLQQDLERARAEARSSGARADDLDRELRRSQEACRRAQSRAAALARRVHALEAHRRGSRTDGHASDAGDGDVAAAHSTSGDGDGDGDGGDDHDDGSDDDAVAPLTALDIPPPDGGAATRAGLGAREHALVRALEADADDWDVGDAIGDEGEEGEPGHPAEADPAEAAAPRQRAARTPVAAAASPRALHLQATAPAGERALASVGVHASPTAFVNVQVACAPELPALLRPLLPDASGPAAAHPGFWVLRCFRGEWSASIVAALPLGAPVVAAWTRAALGGPVGGSLLPILAAGGREAREAATAVAKAFLRMDLRPPPAGARNGPPTLALAIARDAGARAAREDGVASVVQRAVATAPAAAAAAAGALGCSQLLAVDGHGAPVVRAPPVCIAAVVAPQGRISPAREAQPRQQPARTPSGPVPWLARGGGRIGPDGAFAVLTLRTAAERRPPCLRVEAYVQDWGGGDRGDGDRGDGDDDCGTPVATLACDLALRTALAVACEAGGAGPGPAGAASAAAAAVCLSGALAAAQVPSREGLGGDAAGTRDDAGAPTLGAVLDVLKRRARLTRSALVLDTAGLPAVPVPTQRRFVKEAQDLLRAAALPEEAPGREEAVAGASADAGDRELDLGRQIALLPPAGELRGVGIRLVCSGDGAGTRLHAVCAVDGGGQTRAAEADIVAAVLARLERLREAQRGGAADGGATKHTADGALALRTENTAPAEWVAAIRAAAAPSRGGAANGNSNGSSNGSAQPLPREDVLGLVQRALLDALRERAGAALALEIGREDARAARRALAAVRRRAAGSGRGAGGRAVEVARHGASLQRAACGGGAAAALVVLTVRVVVPGEHGAPWALSFAAYDAQRKREAELRVPAAAVRAFDAAAPLAPATVLAERPASLEEASPAFRDPATWRALAAAVAERVRWSNAGGGDDSGAAARAAKERGAPAPRGRHAGTLPAGAVLVADLATPRRVLAVPKRGVPVTAPSSGEGAPEAPGIVQHWLELPCGPGEARVCSEAYLPGRRLRLLHRADLGPVLAQAAAGAGIGALDHDRVWALLRAACARRERERLGAGVAAQGGGGGSSSADDDAAAMLWARLEADLAAAASLRVEQPGAAPTLLFAAAGSADPSGDGTS